MKTLIAWCLVLAASSTLAADRIQSMAHPEECTYRARLAAAGAYTRITKTADGCSTIRILWHGDETEHEKEYVRRWTCQGFESGQNPVRAGDVVFESCMKEQGT